MFENLIMFVFILGYAAIAMEQKIGVNKAASALLTAVVCWILLARQQASVAAGSLDPVLQKLGHQTEGIAEILIFLIGAMAIVQMMEDHGGFRVVTDRLKVRNKRALLWVVSFVTFFLSAVLNNLTTAIVMVSLFQRLIKVREERLIFGAMVIIAANAGGAWTPIGDVTTTMLWIGGQVGTFQIMKMLLIPSLLSMVVPLAYFTFSLGTGEVSAGEPAAGPADPGMKRIFALGFLSLVGVPVFSSLTGLPPYIGIVLVLGVMWLAGDMIHGEEREHLKLPQALRKIDMGCILFFLGILLAVAALEAAGTLKLLAAWMDHSLGNKDLIAMALGFLSAIVDNVPLTAATMGMYDLARYPMDSKLWELLAYSVGTGGSLLIIGSAAGVVVMGMEKIDFMWYLKKVTLPAAAGYLAGIGSYLLIYRLIG